MEETLNRSQELKNAFEADIPHIYSNGFSILLATGDVVILLKEMGFDVATLNLSYSVAKTLAEKLGGAIKLLESKTENTIMTTDFIEKSLTKGKTDATDSKK